MGIFVSGDGEVELQASNSTSAYVVLGCGSCSLEIRLVINGTNDTFQTLVVRCSAMITFKFKCHHMFLK
jgi:hypothetical protein